MIIIILMNDINNNSYIVQKKKETERERERERERKKYDILKYAPGFSMNG